MRDVYSKSPYVRLAYGAAKRKGRLGFITFSRGSNRRRYRSRAATLAAVIYRRVHCENNITYFRTVQTRGGEI